MLCILEYSSVKIRDDLSGVVIHNNGNDSGKFDIARPFSHWIRIVGHGLK